MGRAGAAGTVTYIGPTYNYDSLYSIFARKSRESAKCLTGI